MEEEPVEEEPVGSSNCDLKIRGEVSSEELEERE
jgi:hypothetical protein